MSDVNQWQLWIPPGHVHGFVVLSEVADFEYKCTDFFDPEDEIGVIWSDPEVRITWPTEQPIVSEKDAQLPRLAELRLRP